MDGILFDSMPKHAIAWEQCMEQLGFPFTATDAYLNEGRTGFAVLREHYRAKYKQEPSPELVTEMYAEKSRLFEVQGMPEPIEGVRTVLEVLQAHQKQLFVVTGSGQISLLDRLNTYFPSLFHQEKMVTAYDVTKGKPHPEPYLKALEKSGVMASEAVVIENAPLGVQSGKAAGLFTIAVNTGILSDAVLLEAGADVLVHSMAELMEYIRGQGWI